MKKSIVLTIVCLALAMFVAACGGDDDDSGDGGNGASTVGPSGKTGRANVKTVEMKDTQYRPAQLTVAAGTTIQWTNSDDVPHTVTKADGPGPRFDSKSIDPGDSFERNFPDKGTISYFCTIHPNQKGTLTLQ